MNGDDASTSPEPDEVAAGLDPSALKDAHGRTGRMFKAAGLPFEEDEFDDEDSSSSSSSEDGDSSSSSSSSEDSGEEQ